MTPKPFYVTTAISYPNGAPHIGHAYEMIATDAIARWKRLEGREVYFLTGTDEHGIKMVQTAAKEGIPVRELADRNAGEFKALAKALNLSNDDFIRTTEQRHHEASQAIWKKMAASSNGDIFQSTYKGWYSVRDEAYFDEDELTEKDGKRFAPSGAEVEWVEEPTYFFRLSAYQQKLLDLYEANPDFIAPKERRNEVLSFVKSGLQDLSISRTTFDWGIPVPGAEGHVMYVWVDALTNYITGVGYPDENSELFKKFWPADLHVIGKDIIRFHTVYWPAFLMSAGLEVQHRVFAHGFLTVDGQKMSKSLGNFFTIHDLLETEAFGGRKWPGEVLRLAMLMTHYREPIDFSQRRLEEAESILERLRRTIRASSENDKAEKGAGQQVGLEGVFHFLADDLNTPAAIQTMQALARSANAGAVGARESLLEAAQLLGISLEQRDENLSSDDEASVQHSVSARLAALNAKNFAEADRIRNELAEQGIALMDYKDETGQRQTKWEVKR